MVGMPGFLARFLTRFLARFLTRVFWQGFRGQKNTALQYYTDPKIQFHSTTGTQKYNMTVLSTNYCSVCKKETIHVTYLISRLLVYLVWNFWGQMFDQMLTIFWPDVDQMLTREIQCTVILGRKNAFLQYYRHSNIQFYSTTGTEKHSLTVLPYYTTKTVITLLLFWLPV